MQVQGTRTGFNPTVLHNFCLGNPELESHMVQTFLNNADALQARLDSGRISRGELQLLIGRCELVGAAELVKLARRLASGGSGTPNALDMHQLSRAFATLVDQLSRTTCEA